jgi:ECF sigma factor
MTDGDTSTRSATQLLFSWSGGDRSALERMLPLVCEEVHWHAALYLSRERSDHMLQPTALVNKAHLRLIRQRAVGWPNRARSFGVATNTTCRILVNHARVQLSRAMVKRDWSFARAWLFDALEGIGASE